MRCPRCGRNCAAWKKYCRCGARLASADSGRYRTPPDDNISAYRGRYSSEIPESGIAEKPYDSGRASYVLRTVPGRGRSEYPGRQVPSGYGRRASSYKSASGLIAVVIVAIVIGAGLFFAYPYIKVAAAQDITAPNVPVSEEKPQESTDTFDDNAYQYEENIPAVDNTPQAQEIPRYFRQFLTSEEIEVQDVLIEAIEAHNDEVAVSGIYEDNLIRIMDSIYGDYPEFFWLDNEYRWHEQDGEIISITLKYVMSAEQAAQAQPIIDDIASYLIDLYGNDTDYEKVKGVYEYIINNTIYDALYMEDQSLYSAMIVGRAVCTGYAKSVQYLLNRLNIEAFYVSGDVFDEGSHAWNIVEIDGDYYHVDATYGDPVTEDEHQELKYDYLCITSEEILRDRKMDSEFPLPECTNTAYNYFVMEDKYLNWLDRDKITELLINSVEAEEACIFKLSSSSDMQQLKKGLLDNDEIWDLIFQVEDYHNIDVEVYYYTLDEEMLSVKLSLEY